MTTDSETLEIERAAFAAWPAAEVQEADGWRLRAMYGVTRRANSAWTAETAGRVADEARLDRAEAFYAARRQPCIVHVSPASPAGLDSLLEVRGYAVDAPVSIQTAQIRDVMGDEPALETATRVEASCFEPWLEISARRGRYAAVEQHYRHLLGRLEGRALYALADFDAEPAAVGLGVVDGDWVGVFGMLTVPERRRSGLGVAVVRSLLDAARSRGVTRAYLQVERDNAAALALYHRLGFRERYGTHYRVKSVPRPER